MSLVKGKDDCNLLSSFNSIERDWIYYYWHKLKIS
jgi:hypothetical protein